MIGPLTNKSKILKITLNTDEQAQMMPFFQNFDKSNKIMRGIAIDNFFEYQRRLKDNEREARKIVIFNSPYQLR